MRHNFKFFFRSSLLFLMVATAGLSSGHTQPLEGWLGVTHSMGIYKDFRDSSIYNSGFPNPETYRFTGLYINPYDGSLLGAMLSDKRVMIGDYMRIGVGLGYVHSNVHDLIDDKGRVYLGRGGVYGMEDRFSYGPLEKSRFGFMLDFSLGLQAQVRIFDNVFVGARYFARLHMTPVIYLGNWMNGYSYKRTWALFARYENFSVLMEWSPAPSYQTDMKGWALTGRYHPRDESSKEGMFLGFRMELANAVREHLKESFFGYSVDRVSPIRYYSFSLIIGLTLSMKK